MDLSNLPQRLCFSSADFLGVCVLALRAAAAGWADNCTLLHLAKSPRIIEDLIIRGADVDAKASNGYTAMQSACHVLSRAPNKAAALLSAATAQGLDLRSLLGANTPAHAETPLHLACQLPLRKAGEKRTTGRRDWPSTSFHVGTQSSMEGGNDTAQLVKALIEPGVTLGAAPINAARTYRRKVGKDWVKVRGETPLHVACENGFEIAALWLIEHGADCNAVKTVLVVPDPPAANAGRRKLAPPEDAEDGTPFDLPPPQWNSDWAHKWQTKDADWLKQVGFGSGRPGDPAGFLQSACWDAESPKLWASEAPRSLTSARNRILQLLQFSRNGEQPSAVDDDGRGESQTADDDPTLNPEEHRKMLQLVDEARQNPYGTLVNGMAMRLGAMEITKLVVRVQANARRLTAVPPYGFASLASARLISGPSGLGMRRLCPSKDGTPSGCCLPDRHGNLNPTACDQCALTQRLLLKWRQGKSPERWCDRLLGAYRPASATAPDLRDPGTSLRKWRDDHSRHKALFRHKNMAFRAATDVVLVSTQKRPTERTGDGGS